ncbi:MAG: hypothetical protein WC401_13045 [Bacteroidales bacterium]
MPYSNIVFVKLFLSLFEEDDRFLYQLNESQQLLYIKMLYMAGSTNNNIPKNLKFICNKINYHHEEECFKSDIKRIKEVFPKFIENDHFYSFEKFEELHNYIGKSKGNPKEIQRMIPEKSKRRVREDKDNNIPPPIEEVKAYCQERNNGIDPNRWFNHYQVKGSNTNKIKYLDYVYLTSIEYKSLVDKFGASDTQDRIARLNEYGHQFPKKFKEYGSHYHTILAWARRDETNNPGASSRVSLTKQQASNLAQLSALRKEQLGELPKL